MNRREIQKPALGLDIEILTKNGEKLDHGQQGELVCSNPFPSMPLSFLNDETGEKYHSAYFDRYAGNGIKEISQNGRQPAE